MSDHLPKAEYYQHKNGDPGWRGKCPTHRRSWSTRFVGYNDNGFIFECPGGGKYFVNLPPDGAVKPAAGVA